MATTPREFIEPELEIEAISRISDLYKTGSREISSIYNDIDPVRVNRDVVQSDIIEVTNDLEQGTIQWINEEFPEIYILAALGTRQLIKKIKPSINVAFTPTKMDNEAVQNISDATAVFYQEALSGVRRKTSSLLDSIISERITYELSKNTTNPITLNELTQAVKDILSDYGVGSITDKSGRVWQLDTYAEMVARTEFTNITNEAAKNQMLQEGLDLVQVSNHFGTCQSCAPFEGKVYSLTGNTPGFQQLDKAAAGSHLFGPNCRHTFTPISLKEAKSIA